MKKFKDALTEKIFEGIVTKGFDANLVKRSKVKITNVLISSSIRHLEMPPSNRLEKLSGDRNGQWSIRVNDKWRVCFVWDEDKNEALNIELVDYH